MPCMHPRSARVQEALIAGGGSELLEAFRTVVRAADTVVVGKGGEFDIGSANYAVARSCMSLVDTDRCLWVAQQSLDSGPCSESAYRVTLGTLSPVTCSPKASLLIVEPSRKPDAQPSAAARSPASQLPQPPSPKPLSQPLSQPLSETLSQPLSQPLSETLSQPLSQSLSPRQQSASPLPCAVSSAGQVAVPPAPVPTLTPNTPSVGGPETWYAMFGGQGASGGQMRELRRVARTPSVRDLLAHLSECVQLELASWSGSQASAPKGGAAAVSFEGGGFDLISWVCDPGSRERAPSRAYLEQVHVSMPLTLAAQLACYCHVLTHSTAGSERDNVTGRIRGALGHSQGAAAAAVVAAAGSLAELMALGGIVIAHVFWLGVRIAEAVAGRGGSWALGVAKIRPDQCEGALAAYLREQQQGPSTPATADSLAVQPRLVLRNGPLASVVAGEPTELVAFDRWLQRHAASDEALRGLRTRLLPVPAPFHHDGLLASVPALVAADVASRQLPTLCASRLRVPVYSCADGMLISAACGELDLLHQLVVQVCHRYIDWVAPLRTLAQHEAQTQSAADDDFMMVDFGPGGGSGCLQLTSHALAAASCTRAPRLCYFSQLFEPGTLPDSWLRWTAPL